MEFHEIIFPDDILEECSFGQRITSDAENLMIKILPAHTLKPV